MNRILIFDDEVIMIRQAARMLRTKGYEVIVVNDAEDVIERVEEHQPDIVLMDVVLEGYPTQGFEATRRIRTAPTMHEVPIIVVSSAYLATFQAEAYDAGATDVDVKPYDFNRLCQKIEHALSGARRVAP